MFRTVLASTSIMLSFGFVALPETAEAEIVRNACRSAERSGSAQLCSCIQSVADRTLSRGDQRVTARIFKDPQLAQDIRMSDRPGDEAFWDRYRSFGQYANRYCG